MPTTTSILPGHVLQRVRERLGFQHCGPCVKVTDGTLRKSLARGPDNLARRSYFVEPTCLHGLCLCDASGHASQTWAAVSGKSICRFCVDIVVMLEACTDPDPASRAAWLDEVPLLLSCLQSYVYTQAEAWKRTTSCCLKQLVSCIL